MRPVLRTYSIESEHSIVLSFVDGTTRRCQAEELAKYLGGKELERVSKALLVRRSFIKRVLPPTAVVITLAATVALGKYDYGRFQQLTGYKAPVPVHAGDAVGTFGEGLQADNLRLVPAAMPPDSVKEAEIGSSGPSATPTGGPPEEAATDGTNLVTIDSLPQVKSTLRTSVDGPMPSRHPDVKDKPNTVQKPKRNNHNTK